MMYEHIKENFINNFLKPRYLWSIAMSKAFIVSNIKNDCPFTLIQLDNDLSKFCVDLGDNIKIEINFGWEQSKYENKINKDLTRYKLVSIT